MSRVKEAPASAEVKRTFSDGLLCYDIVRPYCPSLVMLPPHFRLSNASREQQLEEELLKVKVHLAPVDIDISARARSFTAASSTSNSISSCSSSCSCESLDNRKHGGSDVRTQTHKSTRNNQLVGNSAGLSVVGQYTECILNENTPVVAIAFVCLRGYNSLYSPT